MDTPERHRHLLDPIDRISEILFGLIMALTFTCTISVIEVDRTAVRDMLIGAIGCNIAWGLVDAVMFLLMTLTEKGRHYSVFRFVRNTPDKKKAFQYLADAMPSVISQSLNDQEMEAIYKKLSALPEPPAPGRLTWTDFKTSFSIFFLVFLSTFPVALPFLFTENVQRALRCSNAIAIVMMFACGWILARYSGRNRFWMGLIFSLIGIALVAITIALGG